MSRYRIINTFCLALCLGLLAPGLALAGTESGQGYKVILTNLTKHQVLTPPLLVSHKHSFKLFTLAQPASAELAALAEGGNTQPLMALLGTRDDVMDLVVASEPILPGGSITLKITSKGRFNSLSLAGMLATSNDAFFAINGSELPNNGSQLLTAIAYDAGSEANTEVCSDVPGPPCTPESGNQRVTTGAEGFVHVHNGIHGIGDLNPADLDWHNPVVKVEITRIK
ncbi:spondin domain-containing protein [Geopsychrobacter electrodiphilus]|uniref:spondin domain-containing protein n=1 Tax=Geopsychrobacter electrodiphilus TaxID=225196 RepID=UPI00037B0591|nr:spondin domain-containing protein [Geopsychrobacter electrodiphilus]